MVQIVDAWWLGFGMWEPLHSRKGELMFRCSCSKGRCVVWSSLLVTRLQ
jgi:hypothetical protein